MFWNSCDNKNEFLVATNISFGIKRAREEATEYNKEVVKKKKENITTLKNIKGNY